MNEQRRKELFAEFAVLGEAKVHHLVETNTWAPHDPNRHSAAKEWLVYESSRREQRAEAREEEGITIARKAYWMAVGANIIAVIAAIIAAIGYFGP